MLVWVLILVLVAMVGALALRWYQSPSRNLKVFWMSVVLAFVMPAAAVALTYNAARTDTSALRHSASTEGRVIGLEPESHRTVRFTYVVGGQSYSGDGHVGFGNAPFEDIQVGAAVIVYYDPSDPGDSRLGLPPPPGQIDIRYMIVVSLVFTVLLFGLSYRAYRGVLP